MKHELKFVFHGDLYFDIDRERIALFGLVDLSVSMVVTLVCENR